MSVCCLIQFYLCILYVYLSQIFVESLLTSGRLEDISLAGNFIEKSKQEAEQPDYQQLENEEYGAFEKVTLRLNIVLLSTEGINFFQGFHKHLFKGITFNTILEFQFALK